MTLREALISGLPYKLPEHLNWTPTDWPGMFNQAEIMRTDWQVKYEPVSRRDLVTAIRFEIAEHEQGTHRWEFLMNLVDRIEQSGVSND